MADIEQARQMIPLVLCGISFDSNVSELVFGVDVFDLDFGVQVNPIEQPIKCNSVSPGNMSHCGTPSFNDHLDHCFDCPRTHTTNFHDARLDVRGHTINIIQHVDFPLRFLTSVNDNRSACSLCCLSHVSQTRNNQIPQI